MTHIFLDTFVIIKRTVYKQVHPEEVDPDSSFNI